MSDLKDAVSDGFIELRCCDNSIGFVNPRLFTPEANQRFCAIQQRIGNAWVDDGEAKALLADPASYGPPPDGTPILFSCPRCGAHFTWIGGKPVPAASS